MSGKKKARKKAKSNTKRILRCWEADNLLARYAAPRVVSLKTLCTVCHAEMSGEWVGDPPYTLVCGGCCMSYTVAVGAGVR
jgi:hypothetical protein